MSAPSFIYFPKFLVKMGFQKIKSNQCLLEKVALQRKIIMDILGGGHCFGSLDCKEGAKFLARVSLVIETEVTQRWPAGQMIP